jgi:hypothetical protein
MPRHKIPLLLVIAATLLAAISASATEFWDSKTWNTWSKNECEKLLTESPWTHSWTGVYSVILGRIDRPLDVGLHSNDLIYTIQIRSSLPIREALIREQQLSQNYNKMNADKRKVFDAWTVQKLDQKPDDPILVRVDLTKGAALSAFDQTGQNLSLSLVTEDGIRISPTLVEFNTLFKTFDATFPRLNEGVPAFKGGQKYFSIEFQSPQVLAVDSLNVPIQPAQVMTPTQSVKVKFDLTKMLVNGKPNF